MSFFHVLGSWCLSFMFLYKVFLMCPSFLSCARSHIAACFLIFLVDLILCLLYETAFYECCALVTLKNKKTNKIAEPHTHCRAHACLFFFQKSAQVGLLSSPFYECFALSTLQKHSCAQQCACVPTILLIFFFKRSKGSVLLCFTTWNNSYCVCYMKWLQTWLWVQSGVEA